jgi:hypothetical protein
VKRVWRISSAPVAGSIDSVTRLRTSATAIDESAARYSASATACASSSIGVASGGPTMETNVSYWPTSLAALTGL